METKFHEEYMADRESWRKSLTGQILASESNHELSEKVREYEEHYNMSWLERGINRIISISIPSDLHYELAKDILAERETERSLNLQSKV